MVKIPLNNLGLFDDINKNHIPSIMANPSKVGDAKLRA